MAEKFVLNPQIAKQDFSDNTGHNILKLDNVLVQVQFATSKTKLVQYILV